MTHPACYRYAASRELEKVEALQMPRPRKWSAKALALVKCSCSNTRVSPTRHSRQHAARCSARSSEGPCTSYAVAIGVNKQQTTPQIYWSHSETCSSTTRSRRDKDSRYSRRDPTSSQSHHGLHSRRPKQGLQEKIPVFCLQVDCHHCRHSLRSGHHSILVQKRCAYHLVMDKTCTTTLTFLCSLPGRRAKKTCRR